MFRFVTRLALALTPLVALAGVAAPAQLLPSLPNLPGGLTPLDRVRSVGAEAARAPTDAAKALEAARRAAIGQLIRTYPERIALDPNGFPARAGEIVIVEPGEAAISKAQARGYSIIERSEALGIAFVRLEVPKGLSLRKAIGDLRKLGAADASADQLHFQSGMTSGKPPSIAGGEGPMIGVIDGGVAGATISSAFATGAPRDNDHATAVASLITGSGHIRGGLPGARIASADIFGTDPAGGNATAIAKAIGWMVGRHVSVVTISLVGPANPLLGKVIAAAQTRGIIIVAAVGNNGPASPLAFPASYPGVVAVTGVDGHNRPLIEAGHSSHLDYAAPGADLLASGVDGRVFKVRGTSFAAPFVAATIARFYPSLTPGRVSAALARVDATVDKTAPRHPDARIGRGLVCGECRTPAK